MTDGLLNSTNCDKWQGPTFISYPHFLEADPVLLEMFHPESTLQPDASKHESFLNLDPRSGMILDGAIRTQINVLARPLVHNIQEYNTSFSIE